MTGVLLSTVYRYVAQLKKDGKLEPLPRSGRPRISSPKKQRQKVVWFKQIIIQTAKSLPQNSLNLIPGLNVSRIQYPESFLGFIRSTVNADTKKQSFEALPHIAPYLANGV
ncbi:6607_t:CDS:2 [Paraglomus occultum]|uniref:6607_t:CDS:1 n=1 Tax=Paraglomus occultum TaxID=144539 RepID=A0A9N9C763_9GLOM|nr:6607_t:CDS:2 [Paraglomus occultum]